MAQITYTPGFLEASLEKVSASIREGSIFSFSTMCTIFAVMVVVLPLPAPAKISWGAWVCFMDSNGRGFGVVSKESKEINTTLNYSFIIFLQSPIMNSSFLFLFYF